MDVSGVLQTLLVGVAGSLGAVARYLLGRFVIERTRSQFLLATLLINITGAFCIGLLFSFAASKLISPLLQMLLATGFLGGYTTYGTMHWEAFGLVRAGRLLWAWLYLLGSLLLGLFAALGGMLLGRCL